MTREEAKQWCRHAVVFEHHIDKIYDEFEKELNHSRSGKKTTQIIDLESKIQALEEVIKMQREAYELVREVAEKHVN